MYVYRVFQHLLLVLWPRMRLCSCHTMEFRISSVIYPIDHLKRNFLYTIWLLQVLEQVPSPALSCVLIYHFGRHFSHFVLLCCRTPIELVKCKMQVQMLVVPPVGIPRKKLPGPISLLVSVIRNTGLRGLWLGHTGTFIRETGGTAAWFGTKEYVASLLLSRRSLHRNSADTQLRPWESALSGACAGAAFNLALFPADTVKSTMQTEEELRPKSTTTVRGLDSSSIPRKATFAGTFMALYRAQGIRGLYAGCGITVARSIPSSAIIFLTYDGLKKYFG
jgi:mitochondrial ornithine carrier protein